MFALKSCELDMYIVNDFLLDFDIYGFLCLLYKIYL